ncbi:thiol reductant ABC exporter subunit CydC [Lysinibacillus sp. LZ02]|uniref:thiol reductant ABC exporter subunit CydC n=1 Tax=Lysinibacillus sp. LZ02 TaxID=3420668 RepID=UPI003D35F7CA
MMKALIQMILHDKKDVLLAMTAGTISGLTAVALFAQSGFLISKAALMPPFYIILILTAFLKLFGVAKSASKYAERYISHRVTFRFMSAVRMRFFKKLVPQTNLLHAYKSGDLLNRITSDVDLLQHFFLRVVYPPFIALFVFFATILFTLWFSPWLALILMIGFMFTSIIVPAILIYQKSNTAVPVKNAFTNEATEYLYGYRDLQLHHQLATKEQSLQIISTDYSRLKKQELNREQSAHFWNQFIALLTAFFIVSVGAYFVSIGALDGLYLAMLVLVALTVFESAIPLAILPSHYKNAQKATARLDAIAPPAPPTERMPLVRKKPLNITCENVCYSYQNTLHSAVLHVNCTIAAGEKVAIVGPSGSGKSTLFQLLIHELKPINGEIFINEQPMRLIDEQELWAQMSIQLQHNHFFSGTIQENLLLAKPTATDEELQQVLNQVFITKPLSAIVYEKGGNLSGGEKQRLAFARVLLKNSDLWLLDEPFTSIDAQTEAHLFNTLLTKGKDKTIVLITHKLTDLAKMDRIFVMNNGTLAESGTFEQLLTQRGLFHTMYMQQIRGDKK